MDDLTLVGVHEDGEHLLLAGPTGQRYRLRVDEALRAAVRRDRARLGQLQLEADGRLRPKEIQARIRGGETAEEIAATAGLTVEHVRRYEGPVLAEREFVATQARGVRLRRPAGPGQTLGELVEERLTRREVDPEDVTWDAWRAEEGTWVVAVEFAAGSARRSAQWSYDPSVRHLSPQDDEARWLTDEERPAERPAPAQPQRRLAPVRSRPEPAAADDGPELDLLDSLRERRGRRTPPPVVPEPAVSGDPVREYDTLMGRAEQLGEPPAAHPARSRPSEARDGEVLVLPDAEPLPGAEEADEPAQPDVEEDTAGVGAAAGRGRRPNRKQRRASVPSWDDIVFGQRRD